MNGTQVVECAYDLIMKGREYHCALEDFILFFERAKTGEYGKVYNRIDSPVVLGLFDKYLDNRYAAIADYRQQEQQAYLSAPKEESSSDKAARALHGFGGAIGDIIGKMKELPYHSNSKLEEGEIKHPHRILNPKK